jgi:transcriptional regulator with XRE-family HTH domain
MPRLPVDPAMKKAATIFEASGKSLDQLGNDMGYKGDVARKSAWQFLNKTTDPRLSMLRRFAKAMGVSIEALVGKETAESAAGIPIEELVAGPKKAGKAKK